MSGFKKFRMMALEYLYVLLNHFFAAAGKMTDFGDVQSPEHQELYSIVVLSVPAHGFLAMVDLACNVLWGNFLFVQLKDYLLVGDTGAHVQFVTLDRQYDLVFFLVFSDPHTLHPRVKNFPSESQGPAE